MHVRAKEHRVCVCSGLPLTHSWDEVDGLQSGGCLEDVLSKLL